MDVIVAPCILQPQMAAACLPNFREAATAEKVSSGLTSDFDSQTSEVTDPPNGGCHQLDISLPWGGRRRQLAPWCPKCIGLMSESPMKGGGLFSPSTRTDIDLVLIPACRLRRIQSNVHPLYANPV